MPSAIPAPPESDPPGSPKGKGKKEPLNREQENGDIQTAKHPNVGVSRTSTESSDATTASNKAGPFTLRKGRRGSLESEHPAGQSLVLEGAFGTSQPQDLPRQSYQSHRYRPSQETIPEHNRYPQHKVHYASPKAHEGGIFQLRCWLRPESRSRSRSRPRSHRIRYRQVPDIPFSRPGSSLSQCPSDAHWTEPPPHVPDVPGLTRRQSLDYWRAQGGFLPSEAASPPRQNGHTRQDEGETSSDHYPREEISFEDLVDHVADAVIFRLGLQHAPMFAAPYSATQGQHCPACGREPPTTNGGFHSSNGESSRARMSTNGDNARRGRTEPSGGRPYKPPKPPKLQGYPIETTRNQHQSPQ